jgi:hypothetical protein
MNDFRCPKCQGILTLEDKIVFLAEDKQKQKGLIFLSPKLGDYTVSKQDLLNIEPGDRIGIFCPLCHADLLAVPEKDLARIEMIEDDELYSVLFSIKCGEKSTYMLKGMKLKEHFGKHSNPNIDFQSLFAFGGGMM